MSHAGDDDSSNTSGKRAVKTTIVGGQSQENRRPLPPIPIGIEQLLSIAAVSREFATALVRDRDAAIEAAALELTPTERRILSAVDDRALRRMIASAEGSVPDRDRRAFLTRSAAALLVLAGGAAVASASACGDDSRLRVLDSSWSADSGKVILIHGFSTKADAVEPGIGKNRQIRTCHRGGMGFHRDFH